VNLAGPAFKGNVCLAHVLITLEYLKLSRLEGFDQRLLQDMRRELIGKEMELSNPNYVTMYSLASALHQTYAKHLGLNHPVTLFFELPAVKSRIHLLQVSPSSLSSKEKLQGDARQLLFELNQWVKAMSQWIVDPAHLHSFSIEETRHELLKVLMWLGR
jgi:hypothetical protein